MKFFTAFLRGATTTMTPAERAARAERQAEVTERIAQQAAAAGDPIFAKAAKGAASIHRGVAEQARKAGKQ